MADTARGKHVIQGSCRRGFSTTVSIPLPESDFKSGTLSFGHNDLFVFGKEKRQAHTVFVGDVTGKTYVRHRAIKSYLADALDDEGANIYGEYLQLNNIWIEGNKINLEFEHDTSKYDAILDINCKVGWAVSK